MKYQHADNFDNIGEDDAADTSASQGKQRPAWRLHLARCLAGLECGCNGLRLRLIARWIAVKRAYSRRALSTVSTLAPISGDDLNRVAIFEDAGGWCAERGATDARQMRRVGESCRVRRLGEGRSMRAAEQGGQQAFPA